MRQALPAPELASPGAAPVPGVVRPLRSAYETDEGLVARARAGDRWAEEALYRRHAPRLTSAVTRLLGSATDADDVIQDTFLRALEKLTQLREDGMFASWLTAIAMNAARARLRQRKIMRFLGLDGALDGALDEDAGGLAATASPGAPPWVLAQLREIDQLLARQPEEYRAAWLLHRVEEWTIDETSRALGRAPATIKRYVAAIDVCVDALRRDVEEAAR